MKTWILVVVMMMGVAMNAQHGERRHEGKMRGGERMEHFTPEQRAELQVKKMTLALDLNEKQQKEIKSYLLEKNKDREKAIAERKANREAGKKMTADERFAMKSRMLDNKIAAKEFFRKTLDAEQLAKMEEIKNDRHEKITKKSKKFKNRHWR